MLRAVSSGSGLVGRRSSGYRCGVIGGGSTPEPPALTLDAPLYSAIASDGVAAFGYDRLVHGFSSNTVRLKRLSDNAESDFGFDALGMFDNDAVDTWRAGANVDVVKFYDQKGSAVTLDAVGQVTHTVSDVTQRFATNWSNYTVSADKTSGSAVVTVASTTLMAVGMLVTGAAVPDETVIVSVDSATQVTLSRNCTATETSDITIRNGLLQRDNSNGGVGCSTGNNLGHLVTSTTLTVNTASGMEIHMLWSPNKRKIAPNASTVYGGSTSTEYLWSYGLNSNVVFRDQLCAGTAINIVRVKSSSGDSNTGASGGFAYKQFSQHAASFVFMPTTYGMYYKSGKEVVGTISGTTDITGGALNNGKLIIASDFSDGSGNIRTTNRADILFGGVIVTLPLTDNERWRLLNRLHAVGQQHRIMLVDDLKALYDDIIIHSNIDTVTGSVAGENETCSFDFNLSTIASPVGTPTFTPGYEIPNVGVTGLRSTNDNDNAFISDDAVPPDLVGTIVSLNMTESTGNNLTTDLAISSDSEYTASTNTGNLSFGSARDHSQMSALMLPAVSRQGTTVLGVRYYADRSTQFGASVYDGSNQLHGKYNRSVGCVITTYGETISSVVRTSASWMNTGTDSLGLDANVLAHLPENISNLNKDGRLTLQLSRFEAPAGYNKGDDWATRLPFTLQSDNWHFVGQGVPFGHRDGSIAHNPYGGVVDNATGAKFKSFHGILQSYSGVRVLWAWSQNALTDEQVEQTDINLYKLLEA